MAATALRRGRRFYWKVLSAIMIIRVIRQALSTVDSAWVAAGFFEKDDGPAADIRETSADAIRARLTEEKEIKGALGELTPLHAPEGFAARSLLLVGLGPKDKFDARAAFTAGAALGKRLAGGPKESVAVGLAAIVEAGRPESVSALVEGIVVGTQSPALRKSEPNRHVFGRLDIVAPANATDEELASLQAGVVRGEIVGEAVNLARRFANTPPVEKQPPAFAEMVRQSASEHGITAEVWDEERIRGERFGGLLAVAAGSDNPPAFVVLEYANGGNGPTLALVGKGVTFDSGGLSIKPSASMEDMKSDMTGAAVVVASMIAAARLKLPVNVKGYLAITENMTGGRAMKLGDVLTMRNGKTVEVLNTDAEGRLILADALSFAAEAAPARILDLATLTGACIVALGTKIAGLFTNDEEFGRDVREASERAGERVWPLPMDDDFKELLKSNVADLKNVGGRWGGAVTAAKFLEEFVGSVPWVHLDIAGPSWSDSDASSRDVGGTGCFVRSLVAYLEARTGS